MFCRGCKLIQIQPSTNRQLTNFTSIYTYFIHIHIHTHITPRTEKENRFLPLLLLFFSYVILSLNLISSLKWQLFLQIKNSLSFFPSVLSFLYFFLSERVNFFFCTTNKQTRKKKFARGLFI